MWNALWGETATHPNEHSQGDFVILSPWQLQHALPLYPSRGRQPGWVTSPRGELTVLEVVGVQLQPQQEVVELRHKGPIGEDAAESTGQPGPWDHHCGVQDVGLTFGDFRQEWLILCMGEGG